MDQTTDDEDSSDKDLNKAFHEQLLNGDC
jgi:hypothetical protein